MDRKLFPATSLLLFFIVSTGFAQIPKKGEQLPAWQSGFLDLHHINTGRGNAAYFIFPDGTTMLFDAGEENPLDPRTTSARNTAIRPNNSKKPFEWIANYIKQVAPSNRKMVIDYAVLSHLHDDHMGAWYTGAPASAKGKYVLTGIPGVDELVPIGVLFDRGFPAYDYPYNMRSRAMGAIPGKTDAANGYLMTMQNYISYADTRQKNGRPVQNMQAGSRTQIRLKYQAAAYPDFYVQNVKSNGHLWTGKDSSTTELFPPVDTTNPRGMPTENACSQALTLNYGPFKYYTGGDCPGNVNYGEAAWMDTETPLSKSIGAVDIAITDHHGNRDAVNENMVKTLRPRVWIEPVWSSDHPGQEVLIRMISTYLYPGPRDLFATNMMQANRDVIGARIENSYRSLQGHILVRVLPGGKSYYVIILDDSVPELRVKDVFGPYETTVKSN